MINSARPLKTYLRCRNLPTRSPSPNAARRLTNGLSVNSCSTDSANCPQALFSSLIECLAQSSPKVPSLGPDSVSSGADLVPPRIGISFCVSSAMSERSFPRSSFTASTSFCRSRSAMSLTSIRREVSSPGHPSPLGIPAPTTASARNAWSYSIYSSRIDWRAITPSESEEISDTDRDVWQLLR